jgi:hypothetical protein
MFNELVIPGFSRYSIDMEGNVRILKGRNKVGQYLKPRINQSGYLHVNLRDDDNKEKTRLINRLVMLTFFPREDSAELVVMHLDDNKTDNNILNLNWGTHKENTRGYHKADSYGVYETKQGTFQARAYLAGKLYVIGTFPTKNEAMVAQEKAERNYLDFGTVPVPFKEKTSSTQEGVYWRKARNRWIAYYHYFANNGKRTHKQLGTFKTEAEAIECRLAWEVENK